MDAQPHPNKKYRVDMISHKLYSPKLRVTLKPDYASQVTKHDGTQQYSMKSKIIACDLAETVSLKGPTWLPLVMTCNNTTTTIKLEV